MTSTLLSALKVRLPLPRRPVAPPPDRRVALEQAQRALYRLVEPMCAGLDAVEYAHRIVSHPSVVLHRHALNRLHRQRAALRDAYRDADQAIQATIHALEEANRDNA